jgi:hypothetical protein
MNRKKKVLAERRALLVARGALYREELAYHSRGLERPIQWLENGLAVVGALRSTPLIAEAAAGLLFAAPGGRFLKGPRLLWTGWKLLRMLRWPRMRVHGKAAARSECD